MTWRVTSRVYGSSTATKAELWRFPAASRTLRDAAADARALATSWLLAMFGLGRARTILGFSGADSLAATADGIARRCDDHVRSLHHIAGELTDAADALLRAHSAYSQADASTATMLDELLQFVAAVLPAPTGITAGGLAVTGTFIGLLKEGRLNAAYALGATAPLHEGLIAAAAGAIAGAGPISGLLGTREVGHAAARLSPAGTALADHLQGNRLEVTEVTPTAPVLRAVTGIADALHGLERLGGHEGGLDYGTVGVQRFRRPDGSRTWLVTIPGTDGHQDTPFGWLQNVDLMSANPMHRAQTDSVRLVVEAMRCAGVRPGETVSLVGHSQGGIVAGSLASDTTLPYRFAHVVTAGAPIASHPIPQSTMVTSVEMDDDAVPSLDGTRNPSRESWLTVRGKLGRSSRQGPVAQAVAGAAVTGVGEARGISHGMAFHRAAYADALAMGSSTVLAHDAHFSHTVSGSLERTTYYRGRLRRETE